MENVIRAAASYITFISHLQDPLAARFTIYGTNLVLREDARGVRVSMSAVTDRVPDSFAVSEGREGYRSLPPMPIVLRDFYAR
jgi:hypothetical protein